ncbi:DNA replication protein [Malassezia yamatoensis]|uniref:DNA replication complex GINS protein PSF3 n=1 Tax=Malassezia yamatoensis TaxID=253288 RepID=A0AAJ6CGH9_9BASI|nr:DNA replication protein [Malassezia yamatoensis]
MEQDYWSVETILAENQRIPCIFNVDVPGLGYLEESGETDVSVKLMKIHKNARIELVYWMAHMLAIYDIVTIQMPRAYGSRVRAAIDASPTSLQLHNLLPHWYALAARLAQLLESSTLSTLLQKTYVGRTALIYDLAILLSRAETDTGVDSSATLTYNMQTFMQGLDDSEQVLLQACIATTRTMQEYLA